MSDRKLTDGSMTLAEAIREVEQRRCQRIAVPGEWKVWREGGAVKHEVAGRAAVPVLSTAA